MIDDLKSMAIFAEVVKFGSFRSAATALDLSPSVISYHVSQLEERLKVALLYRSTRKLSLTSQGEDFFEHVQAMLCHAQLGLDNIQTSPGGLSGKLSVSLPTALIKSNISQKLVDFSSQNPNINLALSYSDERKNIIEEGLDLAIRAGEMQSSDLKAKRIGSIKRMLVCSTDYFNQRTPPIAPQNLSSWQWIKLEMLKNTRTFTHQKHANTVISYQHKISVNSVEAMTHLAQLSAGLATPPEYLALPLIKRGKLTHVLPEWSIQDVPVYAVWPNNIAKNSLANQLLNFIAEIEYA